MEKKNSKQNSKQNTAKNKKGTGEVIIPEKLKGIPQTKAPKHNTPTITPGISNPGIDE